jgi:uncharacterized protein YcfL
MKCAFFPLTLIVLVGCQSEPTVMVAPPRASQTVTDRYLPATSTPIGAVANLRQPETVKVYGMNRYIDPADSRVLHERHAVYRLEQQPAWVTRSPRNQNEVILGPIVGLPKPEYAPEPVPGETVREIFQARRGIQEANEGMRDIRESQEKLTSNVEAMAKNTAEAERKLTTVVSLLNERVKHLEGDNSTSVDEPTQGKTTAPATPDVVVRSPNP